MSLDVLDGTWAWVWKERPETVRFCRGLIVRAANGEGITDPQGFDFHENYRRWRAAFSGPLMAWTYLYARRRPGSVRFRLAADVLRLSDRQLRPGTR